MNFYKEDTVTHQNITDMSLGLDNKVLNKNKISDDYVYIRKLNNGSYGEVYLYQNIKN